MNNFRIVWGAVLLAFSIVNSACSTKVSTDVYNPERGDGYYILTPDFAEAPQINGASIFGVRPGSPFLYTVPVTGVKPIEYSVESLPYGLIVNKKSGVISGSILDKTEKEYQLTLKANNSEGEASKVLKVVVGQTICLTPPLGWNSWNCWKEAVSQENVLNSARAMVDKGLKDFGWTYVNIDDVWQGVRGGEYNAIQANPITFPDIKNMCDEIHEMGLKVGIYSTPWVTTYAGFVGGSSDNKNGEWSESMGTKQARKSNWRHGEFQFDKSDARQWADWGIDYLKYDWNPNEPASTLRMAEALRNSGRDIVYSLSNSAPLEHAKIFGEYVNCFRTAGDLYDRWDQEGQHLNIREQWEMHRNWIETGFKGAPGHFPDPDMLVIGHVVTGGGAKMGKPRPSRLTADEQYSHISLWILWAAPLLIGAPVEMMDDFTLSLLTNSEVLEVHQDEIAIPGKSIVIADSTEVIVRNLAHGTKAIGLFNISMTEKEVKLEWETAGLIGKKQIRDIWRQKDVGLYENSFTAVVPSHGVVLIKVK